MNTSTPVDVGLIGAGPWARAMHARILAAGPETRLTAVWARRTEAAHEIAGTYGAATAGSPEELFDRCEAVAFAVPPAVQAELAGTSREGRQGTAAREAARPRPGLGTGGRRCRGGGRGRLPDGADQALPG